MTLEAEAFVYGEPIPKTVFIVLIGVQLPLTILITKMSNRFDNYNNNKGFNKVQKKFVPKNPTPTLSTSLREKQQTSSGSGSNINNSSGRVQPGGVNGNFVYYLPQDEAVAAGFGAEDGGLDALESQKVVDLLNSQLSCLLKLKPKDFWSQGTSF